MAVDESKPIAGQRNHLTDSSERVTVRDLHGGVRGLFALAGTGGLIGGSVAVFVSGNQAGTVALLAMGGIASLLAVVGKMPLRWVIGGHEFDMSEAANEEVADVVISQLGPAGTAEVVRLLAGTEAGGRNPVAGAMFEYVAFEQAAINRVRQAIALTGWSYSEPGDRGYDGFVVTQDDDRIPIEYKLVRSTASLNRVLKTIEDRRTSAAPSMVLVVSAIPKVPSMVTLGQRAALAPLGVYLVDANAADFEHRFIVACRDVLEWQRTEGSPEH